MVSRSEHELQTVGFSHLVASCCMFRGYHPFCRKHLPPFVLRSRSWNRRFRVAPFWQKEEIFPKESWPEKLARWIPRIHWKMMEFLLRFPEKFWDCVFIPVSSFFDIEYPVETLIYLVLDLFIFHMKGISYISEMGSKQVATKLLRNISYWLYIYIWVECQGSSQYSS